jgi:hypothetical protein
VITLLFAHPHSRSFTLWPSKDSRGVIVFVFYSSHGVSFCFLALNSHDDTMGAFLF